MSRNYKFHNPEGIRFVSFALVEWIDLFTRNEYKQIELWSNKVIFEKINHIHYNLAKRSHEAQASNPVEEWLVFYPQDYVYSSARDYAGEKGLIRDVVVVR